MSYTHLTARERAILFHLHQYGYSQREIARRLKRSHTTILRELKRNARPFGWCYCDKAAQLYANKRKAKPRHQKLDDSSELQSYIIQHIKLGWSPEMIAGRIKKDFTKNHAMRIHHESIYQWVYRKAKQGCHLYQALTRSHKKRKKQHKYGACRGAIQNRISIEYRSDGAHHRTRYGHWEGDTMIGVRQQGRIVTHVERKSRYLLAQIIPNGKALSFNQASIKSFKAIPEKYCRSLTLDNGSENAKHEILSKQLNMPIYFARPYASWQRGTNENTNGLIRRYFPKGTNFLKLTQKQLAKVVALLNHRPRKCLNYQTPFEVFNRITHGAL